MQVQELAHFETLQDDAALARNALAQLIGHLSGIVRYPGFFTPCADQITSIKRQLLQALTALNKLPNSEVSQ